MADNAYSLLSGWLRYQRDIGVDGLVFGHGSAVGEILAGGGRLSPYRTPAAGGAGAAVESRPSRPPQVGVKTPAAGGPSLPQLAPRRKHLDETGAGRPGR